MRIFMTALALVACAASAVAGEDVVRTKGTGGSYRAAINEALAIALAIDVLVDFIDTGFDQFVLPFVLVNQASRIGRLNLDVLRKK